MSNPKKYRMETFADFLALAPEQRAACATDMLAWAALLDEWKADPVLSKLVTPESTFIWVDDDRRGEISEVHMKDAETGEVLASEYWPKS